MQLAQDEGEALLDGQAIDDSFDEHANVSSMPLFAEITLTSAVTIIFLADAAGAVSFIGRLRRAHGEVRQQLRWIAIPIALFPVTLLFLMVVQVVHQKDEAWYQGLPIYLDYMALSVCTGVALLRHRMYDVDVVVNRAVVLACA